MNMPTGTRSLRFTAVLALVVLALTGFSTGRHHSRGSGGGGGGCSSSHQDHDGSSSTSGGSSSGSSSGSYGSSGGSSYDSSSGSTYGSDDDGSGTGGGSYRRTHRPTATPSGSGDGGATRDGTAKLISCATAGRPYATVEVSNPNDRRATFTVDVMFLPETPPAIDSGRADVSVPARGTKTVRVPFTREAHIDLLDHCDVDGTARLAH